MITPETWPVLDCSRHTLLAAVAVNVVSPVPVPRDKLPFAARLIPVAAVVPPVKPAMPVAQVVPVPSTRFTLCAVAEKINTEQMYVCLLAAPVMICALAVWLSTAFFVLAMLCPAQPSVFGEKPTTRAVSAATGVVDAAFTVTVFVPSHGFTCESLETVTRGIPLPLAPVPVTDRKSVV